MIAKPGTQQILDRVNDALQEHDGELYEIVAPIETSVLMKDRRYKTVSFKGGEELIFKSVRAGKRSEFIFVFEPVDDQPYTQVEFVEKKVFNGVRDFEPYMVKLLGFAGRKIGWIDAKTQFFADIEEREATAKAVIERSADSIYENNPNYGIF